MLQYEIAVWSNPDKLQTSDQRQQLTASKLESCLRFL